MRAFLMAVAVAVLVVSAPVSRAVAAENTGITVKTIQLSDLVTMVNTMNLINWKVGDTANFDISAGFFGKVGTMVKSVTKDEGAAIWVKQDAKMQGQNQVVEILLNKADGKVLKMIQNGKETEIPNDKIEIISQDTTEVTVPAGTFKVIHIVAKTEKVSKIELWANPKATVMEGTVKQYIESGFLPITMELTSFSHGQ